MSIDVCKTVSKSPSACLLENSNRHDDLWWAMHHSYDPRRATMSLTCYLDDSGSDEDSPITTIGGPVMSRDAFIDFSEEWENALTYYRIPPPLHMADFVRPFGKHIGIRHEIKIAMFNDLVRLINKYQAYSLSVAHRSIVNIYKSQNRNRVGSLTFQSDDRIPALQAADMIAWSSRRRDHTGRIGEFKALCDLLIDYKTPCSVCERTLPHTITSPCRKMKLQCLPTR